MIRRIVRFLVFTLLVVIVVASLFGAWVASRQEIAYVAPTMTYAASTDSAVIERGRYVVRDVAACGPCHGDPRRIAETMAGADTPLSGGMVWDIPPGRFYASNLTPDPETGIGRISDAAVAAALRYGIGHDGRALLPFMEMQGLADEDLVAVLSYLRAQPPVRQAVPAHEYSVLGRVLRATVMASPVGPSSPPAGVSPPGATVENGRYLVESVALCWACHTQRNQATGQLIGPRHGGATGLEDFADPSRTWSPPNITRDPETGWLANVSEDQFVARFRAGRLVAGSPMPWPGLARMAEDDLRAMYRYLVTVPPARNDVGPAMVAAGAPR